MARTTFKGAVGVGWAVRFGVMAMGLCLALVQGTAWAQEFMVWDFGVAPRPSLQQVLLSMEPVQEELKLTDAQKKKESIETALSDEQRKRLDEIQLQGQGPLAFDRPDREGVFVGPPLAERLKLSDDQVNRIRTIVEEGENEIGKAATFPIPLEAKNGPPTDEAMRKWVEGPEFQAAKQKARKAAQDAWQAVIHRIEEVLTDAQRKTYREQLGKPFDFSKLQAGFQNEREADLFQVKRAFGVGGGGGGGGGGGQRADPDFDTKVAHPAYVDPSRHPRVLFDEAHYNFHTASGRYKPFADLIANDGYQVIPNREKFSPEVLRKGDVLIVANALGANGMGQRGASNSAFTDAECDAVRDWIKEGGSFLFITDHAPMGAAAERLANRLGVDMSKGATMDPANSAPNSPSFLVFTRESKLLGDHPITRGRDDSERVNRVQTFTGTSITGPEGSIPILKLADTAVDQSFNDDKPASAAGRAQGLAFALGKGRVVVLGEAAELSAQVVGLPGEKFGMNVAGIDNRQMALNIMHWLSGLLEPREEAPKKKAG